MDIATIEPERFAEKWRRGEIGPSSVLDIREPYEWMAIRLKGCRRIPMEEIPERMYELSKDSPLYILCAHGVRSFYTCRFLQEHGFDQVINVAGGMAEVAKLLDPSHLEHGA